MKKITILLIALMLISVGFLSGCEETSNILSGDRDKFIGSWQGTKSGWMGKKMNLVFLSDGTGSANDNGITWELKDDMLIITSVDGENVVASDYKFLENDTKLQLSNSTLEDTYTKT